MRWRYTTRIGSALTVLALLVTGGGAAVSADHGSDRPDFGGPGGAGPFSRNAVTVTTPDCGSLVLKDNGQPWECTFADDFDGSTLDREKWYPQRTANSGFTSGADGTRACYVDDPANVSVSGGAVHLTLRRERRAFRCETNRRNRPFRTRYTAGSISTWNRFAQTYGRFEVRARVPDTATPGLQQALWLWPVDPTRYGLWPASGEIDLAEMYSKYPDRAIPHLHYVYDHSTTDPYTQTNVVTSYQCRIQRGEWNTYTLTWSPGRLEIEVNGTTCLVNNYRASNTTARYAPFDQPFFPALTTALGSGTNTLVEETPLPATLEVDYLRVWS